MMFISVEYSVSMFSGGWKMRIGLGKVLLKGKFCDWMLSFYSWRGT